MLGIENNFYDSYGNFDNSKFIDLLNKAKKAYSKPEKDEKKSMNFDINLFNSVSRKELRGFINKFSIFINSGIDIKATLGILIKQTKRPYLKRIITEMRENIDHGVTVHETMLNYPKVFDSLTVALIAVGEKTGQLGKILQELDTNILENIETRGRVKSALLYPIILLTLTICMVVFMMIYIVPKITEAFLATGVALPRLTQIVVGISNYLISDWYIVILAIVAIYVIFRLINLNYYGRMFFATLYTKFPIFGFIVKQSNIVYFIKSFTILLDSGVLLLESLKTASNVVPNLAYKRELIRVKNEVELGLTISKSLGLNTDYDESVYINRLFPEDFAFVVSTGEETGSLSTSLKKVGANYNQELRRYIGNLSTLMEPIIIVIVGGLVGTIVIAIMLPFFEIGKVVQNL